MQEVQGEVVRFYLARQGAEAEAEGALLSPEHPGVHSVFLMPQPTTPGSFDILLTLLSKVSRYSLGLPRPGIRLVKRTLPPPLQGQVCFDMQCS